MKSETNTTNQLFILAISSEFDGLLYSVQAVLDRGSSLQPVCAVSEGRSWREAGGRDDGIRGFPDLLLPS